MTNRTQRLFCFVVVLLALAGQMSLHAQPELTTVVGSGYIPPMHSVPAFNSNIPETAPVAIPQLGFIADKEKFLTGDFGQSRGILPVSGSAPVYFSSVYPESRSNTGSAETSHMPGGIEVTKQYIPSNNYYIQSGFFCKREWEMERSTHIPFRFRLGSLAQCNALEGK